MYKIQKEAVTIFAGSLLATVIAGPKAGAATVTGYITWSLVKEVIRDYGR